MRQVLKEWNLEPWDCLGFCAAISGVDNQKQAEECCGIFSELGFPSERILVYNDCEIILELNRPSGSGFSSRNRIHCFWQDFCRRISALRRLGAYLKR